MPALVDISLHYSFVFSLLQYPPPLVPPRGEVNAADAFDIGSFDEDDVKGIKVIDHLQVARQTGPVVCRIALWDYFGGAITSFVGNYKVA